MTSNIRVERFNKYYSKDTGSVFTPEEVDLSDIGLDRILESNLKEGEVIYSPFTNIYSYVFIY